MFGIPAGELPLSVVRLFCKATFQRELDQEAGLGFTLPADIGDLDPGITALDLRGRNLIGDKHFMQ